MKGIVIGFLGAAAFVLVSAARAPEPLYSYKIIEAQEAQVLPQGWEPFAATSVSTGARILYYVGIKKRLR